MWKHPRYFLFLPQFRISAIALATWQDAALDLLALPTLPMTRVLDIEIALPGARSQRGGTGIPFAEKFAKQF
jgi:hypothetical protein